MSRVKQQDNSVIYNFMVYAFALILFLEWVYPVKDVAEPLNLNVFIIYAIFCFAISWIRLHWSLSFGLKLAALGLIIDHLFLEAPIMTKAWFLELGRVLAFNINKMAATQWLDLTAMFRTLLFLLLIWMMSYLLYYWFVTAKRMMLFVVLTFVYLGLLDTFTVYDGSYAIIRTFIVAFLALGLSNFIKEMDKEALSASKKWTAWVAPVVLIVLTMSAIGYTAPKFDPQWPDPVPFLEGYAESAGLGGSGNTVQKIGYGEDDTELGGSFVQDDTPVFRGTAEEKGYWRVESKAKYTGKGWESFEEPEYTEANLGVVRMQPFSDKVRSKSSGINVDFFDGEAFGKLPYQYDIRQFDPGHPGQERNYVYDAPSGSVRMKQDDDSTNSEGLAYKALIERPRFNIDTLKAAGETDAPDAPTQYTQLPDSLPDRVGELAEELTEDINNRYDKAKTIEQYFGGSGFKYQIEDVPVPEDDQDYVDQFLFESQEGYCDNYSSTMAVMLRTLGIPTRWVKGFTPGEKIDEVTVNSEWPQDDGTKDNDQKTLNVYEVKSSNAHSWVDVYFPNVGWVPFEPTQGFNNPTDFETDATLGDNDTDDIGEAELDDEDDEPETQDRPEHQQPEQIEDDDAVAAAKGEDNSPNGWLVAGILAIVLLIALLIFLTRWRWQTAYVGYKIKNRPTNQTFQQAYHFTLKTLAHKGLPKQPDQTLRAYAGKIDQRFDTHLMGELTTHYEQMLYSPHETESSAELTKSWRVLMKRILS